MSLEHSDDELMALIAESQGALPDRLIAQAKSLLTWRTVDDEISALLSDSAHDVGATVRSVASAVRHLEFGSADRCLQIDHVLDQQKVIGHLVGLDAVEVIAEWLDGTSERCIVDDGWFELAVRPGPVRFAASGPDTRVATTEWVTLG